MAEQKSEAIREILESERLRQHPTPRFAASQHQYDLVDVAAKLRQELEAGQAGPQILKPKNLSSVLAIAAASVFFVADILLPRGATPAIGYTLVAVLAGSSRKSSVIVGITAVCTVLIWAGFFLEPSGAPWWMSAFDRMMVTLVLWLALLLVWRRLSLIAALAEQTETLERATQELSRSNAELDRFASAVAHDLRGPLNTIELVATVLAQRCRNTVDAEFDAWISDIRREIDGMSQLIQRLLSYGRVGCGAIRPSSCDCETVLADALRSLSANLKASIVTVTHDPLPVVCADPILVTELLQNLLENAMKYRAGPAPRIHVSAAPENGQWRIAVRDNGIGIKEADRQTIFRPFTQLKHGRAGAGLGLATCKRIVERHGGEIWVESAAGQGSTFFFTLPSVSVPAQSG